MFYFRPAAVLDRARVTTKVADLDDERVRDAVCGASLDHHGLLHGHRHHHLGQEQGGHQPARQLQEAQAGEARSGNTITIIQPLNG